MCSPRWLAIAALASVLVVTGARPPVARAQPATGTADEAETAFRLGNEAFLAGRYREAIAHYFVSNRLAPNKNVAFNIARCYEAIGEWIEAYRYFQEHALSVDDVDPNGAASRGALGRLGPKVALVEIESTPAGALLFIDRRDLGAFGTTPRRVPLRPGTYRFIVELPGYEPFESAPVEARVGSLVGVRAELVALTGTLELSGTPTGARASWVVGGQVVTSGALPTSLVVPAGAHRLRIEAPGFHARELDVAIAPRERRALSVALDPEYGAIVVDGDEPGAIVRLDGAPAGFVPTVLDRVPVGAHVLEIAAEGFRSYRTEVVVARDQRAEVFAQLTVVSDIEAASRARESIADAPASVSLVSAYEMRMLGCATLGDALASQRGTYLTNDYTYPSASFRGVGPLGDFGNRVQIQLDGHVVNYLYDGSSSIDTDLLVGLQGLDRLEIVRGPGSALYGSGAVFGVINLVSPREFTERRGRVGVSALGPQTGRLWQDYSTPLGSDGRFWTYNGVLYTQPHDFFAPGRVGAPDSPGGVASGVGETTAGTSMGTLGWGPLTLAWYYHERDLASPAAPFGSAFGSPDITLLDRRAFVELRLEDALSPSLELSARLAFDHSYYQGVYPYDLDNEDVYDERFHDWAASAEARLRVRASDSLSLLAGLLLDHAFDNRMLGRAVGDESLTLDVEHPIFKTAAYTTIEWTATPELAVHGGLRFDGLAVLAGTNSNVDGEPGYVGFEGALSPRLAAVWRVGEATSLKLVAGSAFRAPTFYELTYGDGGTTQLPPTDLEPERIWTGEIELGQRLGADLFLAIGAYVSSVVDSVTATGAGTEDDPIVYANRAASVSSIGLELELAHELRRGMTFGLTYALQRSRLGGLFDGEALENSPTHLVGARAIVPIVPRALSLVSRAAIDSGRKTLLGRFTGAAVVWDLGLAGYLDAIRADYTITVRNLLDWQYDHPTSDDEVQRQPGLSLFADLSVRF